MSLRRYEGHSPMRVSKDAKYAVTARGEIRLVYRTSRREQYLLTTDDHPKLVQMINEVKVDLAGVEGGAFYINEFHDVLVPDGNGGACYWAGNYEAPLKFAHGDVLISPAATGLAAGDEWTGPHVGIPYVLLPGGSDIRYEKVDGRRRESVFLSDSAGQLAAAQLSRRLSNHKGLSGGRIFINEQAELFTRIDTPNDSAYIYLGALDEDAWFPPPEGYPRP